MLFTGQDESTATALAGNLFIQNTLTAADLAAPVATFQSQASQVPTQAAFMSYQSGSSVLILY